MVQNLSVPFDRRVWRESLALRDAGYNVSVICPKGKSFDENSYESIDNISIYRYRIYQSNGNFSSYIVEYTISLIMTAWLLLIVFRREGFDVIQICNPPDLLIFPVLPFKFLGKKIIFDQHDLCPEIYQTQKGHGENVSLVTKALLIFEKITYRFSDVVMVVNESFKKIALTRGRKCDHEVFIVPNGPSVQNIRDCNPNSILKQGAKYLLVYVGMMGPQDGIDILLRAIRNLFVNYNRDDFHVRIIGSGTVLDDMKRYAEELGIANIVTFTGYLDYGQVLDGIGTADVCLCPDPKTPLNDKCSMVKVVEYMSLGRPLVAFDLEEVRNSANAAALLALPNDEIDFAEKINFLLDNAELRASMGAVGRDRVLKLLNWEHSKGALYAAYDCAFGYEYVLTSESK